MVTAADGHRVFQLVAEAGVHGREDRAVAGHVD